MRDLTDNLHLCSINTATLGHQWDIYKMVDAIARHGFGGIAPWIHNITGEDVSKVSKYIADAGLQLSGYCRSPYIPAVTTQDFMANIDANKRCLDDAVALNAPCFIFVVGSIPDGSGHTIDTARSQVTEGIAMLAEYAHDMPITLGLEPLHPMYAGDRCCLNTLRQAHDMCKAVDANGTKVQVALDVYHCWWDAELYTQIEVLGANNRLCAFHVCDWLAPTTDFLMDRGMMGDGVIDIPRIRQAVEQAGYTDMIEVEIFSHNWGKQDPDYTLKICADRLQSVV